MTLSSVYLYADDLKIVRIIESYEDCLVLQSDINALCGWCNGNKLQINKKKCDVMTFSRKPVNIIQ